MSLHIFREHTSGGLLHLVSVTGLFIFVTFLRAKRAFDKYVPEGESFAEALKRRRRKSRNKYQKGSVKRYK